MSCLIYCYAECHYAECRNAECRYVECHYAGCHYAVCHYAECRHAECRGALKATLKTIAVHDKRRGQTKKTFFGFDL